MYLYLVQHATAHPKEVDPDRSLTDQGETDARQMTRFLEATGIRVKQCFHSGKTRAKQTCEILAEKLGENKEPCELAGIEPNDPVEPIGLEIGAWVSDKLMVGHLPFMARLADHLLTAGCVHRIVDFEPGTVVCLHRQEDGSWLLKWSLRPTLLAETGPG